MEGQTGEEQADGGTEEEGTPTSDPPGELTYVGDHEY